MVVHVRHGPHCHDPDIGRQGTTRHGTQRYWCRACLDYERAFRCFSTDRWSAYARPIDPEQPAESAHSTRRRAGANTAMCAPGSSVSCVARCVWPTRQRCTIWGLASSSIALSLGSPSPTCSTPWTHLHQLALHPVALIEGMQRVIQTKRLRGVFPSSTWGTSGRVKVHYDLNRDN